MKYKTISVDLDSTLVDILEPWLAYINSKQKTFYLPITISDITDYNQKILSDNFDFIETDFYDDIEPIEGAIEFIDKLKEKYNVQIVTHTFKGHKSSKLKFIKRYFGDIKVICTDHCKLEDSKDTILVDDKLEHIERHQDINNDIGIVYSMNDELLYNRTDRADIIRLGDYNSIIEQIEIINKGR